MLPMNLFSQINVSFDTAFDSDIHACVGQEALDVLLRDICLSVVRASFSYFFYMQSLISLIKKLLNILHVAVERRSGALANGRYAASRRLFFHVEAYSCTCSHDESTMEVVEMSTTSDSDSAEIITQ